MVHLPTIVDADSLSNNESHAMIQCKDEGVLAKQRALTKLRRDVIEYEGYRHSRKPLVRDQAYIIELASTKNEHRAERTAVITTSHQISRQLLNLSTAKTAAKYKEDELRLTLRLGKLNKQIDELESRQSELENKAKERRIKVGGLNGFFSKIRMSWHHLQSLEHQVEQSRSKISVAIARTRHLKMLWDAANHDQRMLQQLIISIEQDLDSKSKAIALKVEQCKHNETIKQVGLDKLHELNENWSHVLREEYSAKNGDISVAHVFLQGTQAHMSSNAQIGAYDCLQGQDAVSSSSAAQFMFLHHGESSNDSISIEAERERLDLLLLKGSWGVAKFLSSIRSTKERISEYEQMLNMMLVHCGQTDIDAFVQSFEDASESNLDRMRLFDELVEEEIMLKSRSMHDAIWNEKRLENANEIERISIKLQSDCELARIRLRSTEKLKDEAHTMINQTCNALETLYHSVGIDCNRLPGGVYDFNLVEAIANLEEYIHEMYGIGRLKQQQQPFSVFDELVDNVHINPPTVEHD